MASPAPAEREPQPKRAYRSPRRTQQAEATRQALIDAATRLFTTRGWAATGMRDIAGEAGVATETIYTHFASKAELLRAAGDVAVAGDDAPVPVAERPEFVALGVGSRAERIRAAARLATAIQVRTVGFAKAMREAAPTDETMAAALGATRERQRRDVETGMTLVMGRPPTREERDGMWALLSVDVYLLLVEHSGWSTEQYEGWVTATLDAVIPPR